MLYISILSVSDNGKIPPVLGLAVHEGKLSSGKPLRANTVAYLGHNIYRKITNVMRLTEIKRQDDIEFINILNPLRDGKLAEDDSKIMNDTCSIDRHIKRGQSGIEKF